MTKRTNAKAERVAQKAFEKQVVKLGQDMNGALESGSIVFLTDGNDGDTQSLAVPIRRIDCVLEGERAPRIEVELAILPPTAGGAYPQLVLGEELTTPMLSEMLDFASIYGEFNAETPDGTESKLGSPMSPERRFAIVAFTQLLAWRAAAAEARGETLPAEDEEQVEEVAAPNVIN